MTTQRTPRKRSVSSIYQLKVTLRDSKPPIWRRLQVPSDITLGELHVILQVAMGWWEGHLHQFIVDGTYYGEPSDAGNYGLTTKDEDRARLDKIAPHEEMMFVYEYDFGDSWEHIVLVEKILPCEADMTYPRCIAGRRACPPEDSGGIWGYEHLLDVLRNLSDPEHEEMREWVGEDFDPAAFSIEEINAKLHDLAQTPRRDA